MMTEDAAMQHLRRVRRRKEQAAGPSPRVVLTARDYHWWETTYELLLSPTVRESRFVSSKQGPAPPPSVKHPCMDCQTDISELVNHKWRKRCEPCQAKFEDSTDRKQSEYLKLKARRLASKRKLLRFCACGTDISDRHGRAYRCKKCSRLTRSKGVGALDDAISRGTECTTPK